MDGDDGSGSSGWWGGTGGYASGGYDAVGYNGIFCVLDESEDDDESEDLLMVGECDEQLLDVGTDHKTVVVGHEVGTDYKTVVVGHGVGRTYYSIDMFRLDNIVDLYASNSNVGLTVSSTGWSPADAPLSPGWIPADAPLGYAPVRCSTVMSIGWSPAHAPSQLITTGTWAPIPSSWKGSQGCGLSSSGIAAHNQAPQSNLKNAVPILTELIIFPGDEELATEAMTSQPLRTDIVDYC